VPIITGASPHRHDTVIRGAACAAASHVAAGSPHLALEPLVRAVTGVPLSDAIVFCVSSGVISVSWQPFSARKHYGGEIVDVHVTDRLLEVWRGNEADQDPRSYLPRR
jgi:hypothetical protein